MQTNRLEEKIDKTKRATFRETQKQNDLLKSRIEEMDENELKRIKKNVMNDAY